MHPYEMTVSEASSSIAAGQLSPTELFDSVVGQLERMEPGVAAFDVLTLELAQREALAATELAANGQRHSPLLGIPMGIKSLIDRDQVECTSSSMPSASSMTARRKAAREFSYSYPEAPRWAITLGRRMVKNTVTSRESRGGNQTPVPFRRSPVDGPG